MKQSLPGPAGKDGQAPKPDAHFAFSHLDPLPLNEHRIVEDLLAHGWSVIADFLEPTLVEELREECRQYWQAGMFRHAGIGRGESFEIKPHIRNDRVLWLQAVEEKPALRDYLQRLETLRLDLNRELQLGLFEYEGHLAVYPPGSFYAKHRDQFRGIGLRTVSVILYLNDDWQDGDGGRLRLYTDVQDESRFQDIAPLGGQLVVFMSADFLHEVLPARRERMSITGWFKRRDPRSSL